MLENFHTHTHRCRHAVGTEDEYVQCAIAGGLQVLGFSDHTPFIFPGDYYSRMRMYPDELADYAATVHGLKEKYAGQIDIHLGLEVEYYPNRMADLLELIDPYGIEYMIMGQHWCGDEQGMPFNGKPTDKEENLALYCDQIIAGMETGMFSYIAHPDLLCFTGDESIAKLHWRRLCQRAKQLEIPMEINLLGLRSGRHYPVPLFWETAAEENCAAVLGSDAHTPQDVIDPRSEEIARGLVQQLGISLLEHIPVHSYRK